MLDFIGTIVIVAVTIASLNALVTALAADRWSRLALAAAVGGWVGLAVALASAGALAAAAGGAPVVGLMVAAPLVIAAAAAFLLPAVRKAMLGAPLPLLVGLNIPRVLGVLFLLLAAESRLSGPFPYSAGWGDIITGLLALPAAALAARPDHARIGLLHAWNAFGALDLFAAIAFGVTSAAGSPLQLIHAGVGSMAMQSLPWSLVPTVLVPFYLIMHGVIFAQLRTMNVRAAHPAPRPA
ncbi:MAG TPA: hypothetical protein VKT73_02355 [Xanthobacteraceae bacterium]|nr:hypothetical protein [Xanthobacteraceae bacterium]